MIVAIENIWIEWHSKDVYNGDIGFVRSIDVLSNKHLSWTSMDEPRPTIGAAWTS